jgi:hypothetical protein
MSMIRRLPKALAAAGDAVTRGIGARSVATTPAEIPEVDSRNGKLGNSRLMKPALFPKRTGKKKS